MKYFDKEKRDKAYLLAEKHTLHSQIYYHLHVVPVAQEAKMTANILKADQDICELAGLFHDIGYTEDYSPEDDHIKKGIVIADKEILPYLDIAEEDKEKILDCIRTHDGNLKQDSPLENRIVNDADAFSFFLHPECGLRLYLECFKINETKTIDLLKKHAEETFSMISLPYFRKKTKPFYEEYHKKIEMLAKELR